VADWVKTHEAWGIGAYCFFNVDPTIHATHGFEVPDTPGVKLHDLLTLSINNSGTIDHVVNAFGPPTPPGTVPVDVVAYPEAEPGTGGPTTGPPVSPCGTRGCRFRKPV
jgi:hypothetical protein